ncbi:hypothetical protein NM688_g9281 [Phlebia brevispora]|uniref:Uncharacterized protein n=1 Tax=Phlebia brevispora TaxID=194682 RepID=A0ACC1RI22_9APHY|nr:hypothetical protein NM688_g9281 [Phlebia brevispora]
MAFVMLKVPLLVIQVYYTRIATKAPTPPPTLAERKPYTKLPELFPGHLTAKHFRYPFYVFTAAEISAILLSVTAPSFPSITRLLPAGSTVLNAHDIYLSKAYVAGLLFLCAGGYIRGTCYRHLGHLFTYHLSVKKDHRLVTDGPYVFVRHSSYTGICLFFFGVCYCQLGPGSWLTANGVWDTVPGRIVVALYIFYSVASCIFLVSRVTAEDAVMKQQFGQEWEDWAKRTPYRLVPYVY